MDFSSSEMSELPASDLGSPAPRLKPLSGWLHASLSAWEQVPTAPVLAAATHPDLRCRSESAARTHGHAAFEQCLPCLPAGPPLPGGVQHGSNSLDSFDATRCLCCLPAGPGLGPLAMQLTSLTSFRKRALPACAHATFLQGQASGLRPCSSAPLQTSMQYWTGHSQTVSHAVCLQGHASGLRWCEIVDEGRRIVTVSGNRLINQWDLKTGERIQTFPSESPACLPACLLPGTCMTW